MKQILIIVHQSTSYTGLVGKILRAKGYHLDIRIPSRGDKLPDNIANHQGVVIFGGAMSVNDRNLPFIRQEIDWIQVVLASSKPFLGICLGAQMLARTLGAEVTRHPNNQVEIGYFPIIPTPEGKPLFGESLYVYHWHNEGFDLPKGAVKLADGETFSNQAFRYGENAYGLQFHPELTPEMIDRWTILGSDMLTLPGAQSREQQLQNYSKYGYALEKWLENFLNLWLHPEK
ncbi:MAG TPA: hypothetical protein V6D15_12515 [Oculatellaceae cyanobacterium]